MTGRKLGLLSMIILAVVSPAAVLGSERQCAASFSETGDWNTGKTFKSFIEIRGVSRADVVERIGQEVALTGFQGVTANKDIGVISAYSSAASSTKQSPLNVIVKETAPGTLRAEVVFQLLGGLRAPSASIRDEFCKILEAALPETERAAAAAAAQSERPRLKTASGEVSLTEQVGAQRQAGMGFALLIYLDFQGASAAARTSDGRPTIMLSGRENPQDRFLLVTLDPDQGDGRRSLKLGSAGSLLKMAFKGGGSDLLPDRDWTVPFSAAQEGPDLWRLTPTKELKPGEYGLYDKAAYMVFGFGVGQ